MTTIAPQTGSQDLIPSGPANVYHPLGNGIDLTYVPNGSGLPSTDGPIRLIYSDSHQRKTFRATDVAVAPVANPGHPGHRGATRQSRRRVDIADATGVVGGAAGRAVGADVPR
jgi:hypothetical protein